MRAKVVKGKNTKERLAACWEEVVSDKQDRPTVKEFAKRANISESTLYHCYPEFAEKIKLRRDEPLSHPRRLSPVTQKKKRESDSESFALIDKLRKELLSVTAELDDIKKDRDRWMRQAKDAKEKQEQNERLRAVIMKFPDVLKRHLDSHTAYMVLDEIYKFQEKHVGKLDVTQPSY